MYEISFVRFHGCPIVAVAAKPGGPEASETMIPIGVSELIEVHSLEMIMLKYHPVLEYCMHECLCTKKWLGNSMGESSAFVDLHVCDGPITNCS